MFVCPSPLLHSTLYRWDMVAWCKKKVLVEVHLNPPTSCCYPHATPLAIVHTMAVMCGKPHEKRCDALHVAKNVSHYKPRLHSNPNLKPLQPQWNIPTIATAPMARPTKVVGVPFGDKMGQD